MQPAGLEPASFDRKSKILTLGRRLLYATSESPGQGACVPASPWGRVAWQPVWVQAFAAYEARPPKRPQLFYTIGKARQVKKKLCALGHGYYGSQPRQFSSRMILSVSRYASSTHSTIFSGSGEYSSSMLTVRLNPVSRIARR